MGETTEEQRAAVRERVLGGLEVRDDVRTLVSSPLATVLSDWSRERTWDVWARPQLDVRTRCLVTVAILACLGVERELGFHVRGALRNGATADELVQVVMHIANYAGMPRATEAMLVVVQAVQDFEQETGAIKG